MFMGIFDNSLVLGATDVKKLLNMFAASIGSALAESLETRILGMSIRNLNEYYLYLK